MDITAESFALVRLVFTACVGMITTRTSVAKIWLKSSRMTPTRIKMTKLPTARMTCLPPCSPLSLAQEPEEVENVASSSSSSQDGAIGRSSKGQPSDILSGPMLHWAPIQTWALGGSWIRTVMEPWQPFQLQRHACAAVQFLCALRCAFRVCQGVQSLQG